MTATYDSALDQLSDASVRVNFEAFVDIPWNDPDFALNPSDPRWKLPSVDPLGRHEWYRSLPEHRQIEIGLMRQASVAKVGTQFENALMRGLLQYAQRLPNGSREFRYCMHEVTEETHHTQMFQEFVNRSGIDVGGAAWWFRALAQVAPLAVYVAPELFFLLVLLGEEPLDHVQKEILRSTEPRHPLIERIMQIHVAEEARHISFAHEFLTAKLAESNPVRTAILTLAFPVLARMMGSVIGRPGSTFIKQAGIPRDVVREVYGNNADSRAALEQMFADVRYYAVRAGVLNRATEPLWKLMGVGGRPSRHRGEADRRAIA